MSTLEIITFILIIVAAVTVVKYSSVPKDMEKFNSLRDAELSGIKKEAFKVIEEDLEEVPDELQELVKEEVSNEIEETVPQFSEEQIDAVKKRSSAMVKTLTIIVWLFIAMLLLGLFSK